MSYTAITDKVIVGSQTLTGYELTNTEKNTDDAVVQTVTTYFDANLNEFLRFWYDFVDFVVLKVCVGRRGLTLVARVS